MWKTTSMLAAALLLPIGAQAQSIPFGSSPSGSTPFGSMPPGMYLDAEVSYHYLFDGDGNNDSYGYADFVLGMNPATASSLAIGAEIYFRSVFSLDYNSDITAYGGILFYDSNFGRFSIGNPIGVIGDYVSGASFGTLYDAAEFGLFSGGYTNLLIYSGEVSNFGVRYDGQFGNFGIGASYHQILDGFGLDYLYSVAANYQIGNFELGAGIESGDGIDQPGYYVSAAVEYNNISAGVLTGQFIESDAQFYTAYVDYYVLPQLTLSASLLGGDFYFGGDMFYRLGAEYTFAQNFFIGANYFDVTGGGFPSDGVYEVNAGYRVSF